MGKCFDMCCRLKDAPHAEEEIDIIEKCVGSMKRYQWFVTISCYLAEVIVAFHLVSHGLMVPISQPIYCNNTQKDIHKEVFTSEELKELHEEACNKNCTEILVGNKYYDWTIIQQFELYCGNRHRLITLAQMLTMLGIFCGNLSFGTLADLFGRKRMLILGILIEVPFGIAIAFAPNIYCFLVFKFCLNYFVGGSMTPGFVLLTEIAGKRWRALAGLLAQLPFTMGYLLLVAFAYIYRDWRYFQITISLPALLLVYYIWGLPESPRWLLSIGRTEKGIKQLEMIARRNGMPTDNIKGMILADQEKKMKEDKKLVTGKYKDLFRTCAMGTISINLWINWFAIICCYYGVAQYSASLGSNMYVSSAFAAVIQTPSLLIALYSVYVWGRRTTLFFANGFACISLLVIYFTPVGNYQVIAATISMFSIAISFCAIYVYSGEVFPTPVRVMGMGTGSALGRIGAICATVVADSKQEGDWIPPVIFSSLMCLATAAYFFLPETIGIILPNSVEETTNLDTLYKKVTNCCKKNRNDIEKPKN